MTKGNETKGFANRMGYTFAHRDIQDVHPFEIVQRVTKKAIHIRAMHAVVDPEFKPEMHAGGRAAHCSNQHEQKWIITTIPLAPIVRIRMHKDGKWYDKNGARYQIAAHPVKFYDYNF